MTTKPTVEEAVDAVVDAVRPKPKPMPRLVGDRLLVRQDGSTLEAKLEVGPDGKKIELLESTLEDSRPLEGEVLAISAAIAFNNPTVIEGFDEPANNDKQTILPGDHIKYANYSSCTTIEHDGEELIVLYIDDVICVD